MEPPSRPSRCKRGKRCTDGITIPETALHLPLSGEVRPTSIRRSALYNTDGQIFSDAGVPVVLFMENYDINRKGYHDTHDTLENIDLDYGAALSAIAIESVALGRAEVTRLTGKENRRVVMHAVEFCRSCLCVFSGTSG